MTKARDLANLISGGFTEADIPNLSASKITSGTFADARLSASSVQQFASTFDDNKIVNDISTLGLRVHTQENLNASNTNSASFDVFQDSSGITNLTNSSRSTDEYVNTKVSDASFGTLTNMTTSNWNFGTLSATSGSGNPITITHSNSPDEDGLCSTFNASTPITVASGLPWQLQFTNNTSSGRGCFVTVANTSGMSGNPYNGSGSLGSGFWNVGGGHVHTTYSYGFMFGSYGHVLRGNGSGIDYEVDGGLTSIANGDVVLLQGQADNKIKLFENGTLKHTTTFGQNFTKSFQIGGTGSNSCEAQNVKYSIGTAETFSATGSFEGNAITASSTNKMGAVITYQDQAGTNALNTDIILKLSADNGSNYSTATLTALPDFATGIKMAKVNDLSVTAGTQLKYKIEFANQASGSKEARIRGVSLQY